MPVEVRWIPPDVIKGIQSRLRSAPAWMPNRSEKHMRKLGGKAVRRMKYAVMENVYTGKLQDSIRDFYEDRGMTVLIAPTVMRGRYDGGSILEAGTRPIPNAPWAPIARWAAFRGLSAFPVVYKIRTQGVDPHPFLQRTLDDTRPDIDAELGALAEDILAYILNG